MSAGEVPADEFEALMTLALERALDGQPPRVDELARGNSDLAARLQRALDHALGLLPQRHSLRAGRIGPYVVERELGSGGMGTVYLARHHALGHSVAVKVLPRPLAFTAENRTRFEREARALARVRHPHVLPVSDFGEEDGVPYFVTPFARGGTLEDLLRSVRDLDLPAARLRAATRLPGPGPYEARVARLLAAIADGLDAAHRHGLLHRDIKPSNVLLDEHGGAMLGDFGLAKSPGLESLTASGAIVGTRQYLAPELTIAGAPSTVASDIYALGITLYELLAFRAPFRGGSEQELFRAIRELEPARLRALNRHVSPELEAVCAKALEKDCRHRYAQAAVLRSDLQAVLTGAPVGAKVPARTRRVARFLWYHRRRWLAPVTAALVIVSAGVPWLHHRQRQREEEFRTSFAEAESLFVTDAAGRGRAETDARQEALRLYRRCAELQPDRLEPWLRLADVALRLDRTGESRTALDRAAALEPAGWYAARLRRELGDPSPEAPPAHSDVDRFDRAYVCYRDGRYAEAFELTQMLLLDPQRLLAVELLQGVILHQDVFVTEGTDVPMDVHLKLRLALGAYDRFLARVPGNRMVSFNRAILIRDGLAEGGEFGVEPAALFASAARLFRDSAAAHRNLKTCTELLRTLATAAKLKLDRERSLGDALVILDAMSDEQIAGERTRQIAALEILTLSARYDRVLALLRIRDPEIGGFTGACNTAVQMRLYFERLGCVDPDPVGLQRFVDSVRGSLDLQDSRAVDAALAK